MSQPTIRVEGLGKRYRIGLLEKPPETLREAVVALAAGPFSYLRRMLRPPTDEEILWALRDVSFEVKQGEVVGIVGQNGAGKSTLLKILTRITEPTEGRAVVNGRLGSLLEVGTGFHPELTGRENVYLNGAILGMRNRETAWKFDEIVDFAEVDKFIDTPVKRYSSGMYVRLAFAVAAHLNTDILLMDEVLAVGDARFRLKCYDKIYELMQSGKTILLVSHDMAAVTRLCKRVLLLNRGVLTGDGPAFEVVGRYLTMLEHSGAFKSWENSETAPGNAIVRLRQVRVRNEEAETADVLDIRRPIGIEATYDVLAPGHILIPNYHFHNDEDATIFAVQDTFSSWRHQPRPVGRFSSTAWLPGNFLAEGRINVSILISSHQPESFVHVKARNVLSFQVIDPMEGDSVRGDYTGPYPGLVRPLANWDTEFVESAHVGLDRAMVVE